MFDAGSGLVKLWVEAIKEGKYTIDNVPNLSNLKDVVQQQLLTQ